MIIQALLFLVLVYGASSQNALGSEKPEDLLWGYINNKDHEAALELLEENPKLLRMTKTFGATPLHHACNQGLNELALELLKKDPGLLTAQTKFGSTALHKASFQGHTETVRVLIDFASSNACEFVLIRDNNGETALHHACRKDHRQIAQILLESNPKLMSIKDKTRKIALYYMSESMIKDPQLDTIIQDFVSNNHSLESSLGKRGNSFDSSSFDSIPEK